MIFFFHLKKGNFWVCKNGCGEIMNQNRVRVLMVLFTGLEGLEGERS